jgi:hypothetical protein
MIKYIYNFMFLLKNKYSFKLISRKKISEEKICSKKPLSAKTDITDSEKRSFLKLLAITGFGLVASQIIPKKAEALIMGGTPSTSTIGLKNASNVKINPATEDTLNTLLKPDDLNFDSSGYLNVNVQTSVSGGNNSFSDSGNTPQSALVDASRHLQVDVLSSALPTSASTETTLQTLSFGGFKFAVRMVTVGYFDYIGEATIGASTASAVWRIKRIDNTSGLIIAWAGTGGFDQIWNNYASLTYS